MSEEVGKKRKISDQNGIGSSGNKFITSSWKIIFIVFILR